jgi:hypothetical protein
MAFLGMDASQFTSGVDKSEKRVQGFSKHLDGMKGKIAAAFSVAAVGAAVKGIADKASNIADVAENLSITTDEFQALSIAAKGFGIEADDIATVLNKMTLAQSDFVSGSPSKELVDRMAALGISLDQADAMNAAEFFEAVAKGSQSSAEGLDASLKMMGKSGPKFQAFMRLVSGVGLGGMVSGAKASGELISEEDITATDSVVDGVIEKWKNKAIKAAAAVVGTVAGAVAEAPGAALATGAERAERNRAARQRADETSAAKIAEEAADIRKKTAFDLLNTEEKITALMEEQAAIDRQMKDATSATARAELDKQRAEIEGKIAGLEAGNQGPGMAFDQLRRIGAGVFRGTAEDAIPKKQLTVQQKMLVALETLSKGEKRQMGVF